MHVRRGSVLSFLLAVVLVTSTSGWAQIARDGRGDASSRIDSVFVRNGDRALDVLISRGVVRHIEDYGSFAAVLVDSTALGGTEALRALGVEVRDEQGVIGFNGLPIGTRGGRSVSTQLAGVPAILRQGGVAVAAETGRELRLVQFIGPVKDQWLDELSATGVTIIAYVPQNTYVVAVPPSSQAAFDDLSARDFVGWTGTYEPVFKIAPDLRDDAANGAGESDVTIQFIADEEAVPVVMGLVDAGYREIRPSSLVLNYLNLHMHVPNGILPYLAAHPSVFAIERKYAERRFDERQGQIMAGNVTATGASPSAPGYLAWLASKGFSQTGQFGFVVDVTDDGIDRGSTTDINVEFRVGGTAAGAGRIVYNNNYTSDALADGGGGHGNLNASIVGGYNSLTGAAAEDASGYNYGLGLCPFVQLGNSKVFSNGTGSQFTQSATARLTAAYNAGARISSNSWGFISGNNYNVDAQEHDTIVRDAVAGTAGNQEMTVVFAAGNDGSAANTVRPPATGKNIITVGASENDRQTGTDGCAVANSGADNANDIINFSSRGPTADLRKKPEIVAPGTHIQGAASRSLSYNGSGVCNQFWPAAQTLYAWSSGTSHSTPATSGASALVRQFFINQGFGTPSPAMVKAWLMTAAHYENGVGANDTLWSNNQGMGSVDLGRAFNGTSNIRVDQSQVFGTTGQTYTVSGTIATSAQPFRVGLTWTDKPGATTGNAWVNDLDLEVTVNGTLYRGNVFSGASSVTGGAADTRNNAEFVFLPAGVTGTFSVTVRATNVAGDGVPGNADTTDQDFALVVSNGTVSAPTPDFSLAASPATRAVTQGGSTTYTVSNTAVNGFASTITLSASPAITGVTYAFAPNPMAANGSSTLSVTTSAATPAGTYNITVTGTGGALTRTTAVSLTVSPPAGSSQVKTYSASPALAIPDNNATGVTSAIVVPISQAITSVAVSVNVTHTYQGDLVVTLTGPSGASAILHNRTGGGTDNIVTTYSILTTPNQALSVFNGLNTSGSWSLRVQDLAAADVGTLNSWNVSFNGEKSASPALAIPDNNATGITSILNYSDSGFVSGVKVKVNITHTYKGDLVVTLIAPDGTAVLLHNRTGGATDNIQTEFPDLTVPAASLATFVGKSVTGNWSLKVQDLAAADVGTLNSWTLSLNGQ